jgi:TonB family protein
MIAAIVSNLPPWSLQAAAVVAAAALLPWLFRLDVAGVRYTYWRGVAVLCLALPWIQPYEHGHAVATAVTANVAVATSTAQSTAVATSRTDWALMTVSVLTAGILLRLVWLGFGLIKLRRLRQDAIVNQPVLADGDLQPALGTHADIRYARDLQQPVTFGVRRPLVLLPEVMRNQPPDIQRAVIGHELLHVKRRDWAWLIVEEIAVCVFWFHPASWWLASRIQCAREEVVDELAILLTGRRRTYVAALLAFADTTSVVPTAAFARRRHLLRRIALVSKEDVMSSRRIVVTCAAMALIVGLGSWYAVSAFPLRGGDQAPAASFETGPLELKAHPVTPENPVPRRVHYEPVMIPDSIDSIRGNFGVKVTLDDVGRVAEARVVKIEVSMPGITYEAHAETDLRNRGTRLLDGLGKDGGNAEVAQRRRDFEALLAAAAASVRQWRYDPPFEAPLTFAVDVPFAKGSEVMEFKPRQQVMEFKPAREGDALRVGGTIKAPTKVKDVRPVYPPIAREAGVAGVVIIEVKIGTDGRVEEGRVLRSIPLLDQAALDAVKQWEFTPTMLNGVPVPVIMTVTINFYPDGK